jgi:hypothetical protein
MDFENFRQDLETKLNSIVGFELQEYHFTPHSFGSGILAYRIKGLNHKFIYDGRENELTWQVSKPHEKYFGAHFSELKRFDGLNIDKEELEIEIINSAQQSV